MRDFFLLSFSGFFTSIISGSIGMAGGIMMLSIMSSFFSPLAVIPLHGVVQVSSNIFRAILNFPAVHKRIVGAFMIGAILGAALGSRIVISLPEREFRIILAGFILVVTWLPKFKSAPNIPGKFFWIGLVATFISLFVGATGLLIGPFFIREPITKEQVIASQAACQTVLHFLKIIVFGWLGFQFGPYAYLLAGMIGGVLLGNWVGKFLMDKISENTFRWIFRVTCSLLALRMLYFSL